MLHYFIFMSAPFSMSPWAQEVLLCGFSHMAEEDELAHFCDTLCNGREIYKSMKYSISMICQKNNNNQ